MVGFWLGVNFIGWFLAVFWLIKPEFLLPKKQLTRPKVLVILGTILLFDTCLLITFALLNLQVTDVDIVLLIVSIILMVIWTAWCFYRYGQHSILSKPANSLSNPRPNTAPETKVKPDPTPSLASPALSTDTTQTPQSPSLNSPPSPQSPSNEQDWADYKQKMEKAWQETRSKLTEKPKK
ncbi:MAG: hypothetical protein Q4B88_02640 [Moraxella sp.]|nr:hypothetical protein [Moraxella sp.]